MDTRNGQKLYEQAKQLIPGGTQLLSKRPEMFAPGQWPPYYRSAEGCRITDIDGNVFTDMSSMGIGSCILGYAHPKVNQAVIKAVQEGSMSTLNSPQEIDLARLLIDLHPWADMVRYARSGGEIMAIAVRIARAASGRDGIAFCGYHGWHDWYVSANLAEGDNLEGQLLPGIEPNGVPKGLAGTVHPFRYNKIEELKEIIAAHGPSIGAIVMEPYRYQGPKDGFLDKVREIASANNSVLIFDEITSGWRNHIGGMHMKLGVHPDMAVFAKAVSNGFPMAAVIGRREVMDAAQESFISSTYWTDRTGPAAALATLGVFQEENTPKLLADAGREVKRIWKDVTAQAGLSIEIGGPDALCKFSFLHDDPAGLTTLLTQEMLKKGVLGNAAFYASSAHGQSALEAFEGAFTHGCSVVAQALDAGSVSSFLNGPVKHQGFARLT